jgi:hypothetical protein
MEFKYRNYYKKAIFPFKYGNVLTRNSFKHQPTQLRKAVSQHVLKIAHKQKPSFRTKAFVCELLNNEAAPI